MHVYIYMYVYIYIHIYMCVYIYVYSPNMHTCTHTHAHTHTSHHPRTQTRTHTHTDMQTRMQFRLMQFRFKPHSATLSRPYGWAMSENMSVLEFVKVRVTFAKSVRMTCNDEALIENKEEECVSRVLEKIALSQPQKILDTMSMMECVRDSSF